VKRNQVDFFTPSPIKGEGIFFHFTIFTLSPRGEGRVRGHIPNFSHLPFLKGGTDKMEKDFQRAKGK
jgi:hypothetical protein